MLRWVMALDTSMRTVERRELMISLAASTVRWNSDLQRESGADRHPSPTPKYNRLRGYGLWPNYTAIVSVSNIPRAEATSSALCAS